MDYKLTWYGNIINITEGFEFPIADGNRHYEEYKLWIAAGNTPQASEPIPPLSENEAGRITAKDYFASKPAAIAFIRSTPTEQDTQIEAMTLAQLKTVVKYLAVACSALVKQQYL